MSSTFCSYPVPVRSSGVFLFGHINQTLDESISQPVATWMDVWFGYSYWIGVKLEWMGKGVRNGPTMHCWSVARPLFDAVQRLIGAVNFISSGQLMFHILYSADNTVQPRWPTAFMWTEILFSLHSIQISMDRLISSLFTLPICRWMKKLIPPQFITFICSLERFPLAHTHHIQQKPQSHKIVSLNRGNMKFRDSSMMNDGSSSKMARLNI